MTRCRANVVNSTSSTKQPHSNYALLTLMKQTANALLCFSFLYGYSRIGYEFVFGLRCIHSLTAIVDIKATGYSPSDVYSDV